MTMACKTDFLKIDFNSVGGIPCAHLNRCCALESIEVYTPLEFSDEILSDIDKFKNYIFEKMKEVPANFKEHPMGKTQCHSSCLKVFEPASLRLVSFGEHSCNLKCPSCRPEFRKSSKKEVDSYFLALEAFKGMGLVLCPNLSGEPFYYKDRFISFLRNLKKEDYSQVAIVTNATLIDNNFLEELKTFECRSQVSFSVSIDSVIQETYCKTRFPATPAVYNKVLANIDKLHSIVTENGKNPWAFNVSITISDLNCSEQELTAYGEYFSKRGISMNGVVAFSPDDRFGYLREDPIVKNFVEKYHVNLRNS